MVGVGGWSGEETDEKQEVELCRCRKVRRRARHAVRMRRMERDCREVSSLVFHTFFPDNR